MIIVIAMCKLLVALVLGYVLNKKDILDSGTCKKISALILNVSSPMLVFTSVTSVQGERSTEVLYLLVLGVVVYAVMPLIGYVLTRMFRIERDLRGTFMCMVIFSNNVFMGFPVIEAVFGSSSIFYSSIFHMPFNILFYSLGLYLMKQDAQRTEETKEGGSKFTLGQVVNNGVIAAVLAVIVYFTNISVPDIIVEPMKFIGNITSPLSMLVIGSSIAGYSLKEIWGEKKIYAFTFVRLCVLPLIMWALMQLFTDNQMLIGIVTITVGMPIASLVAMGSAQYEKQGKIASISVVCSTICSLITIPILCILLGVG